MSSSTKTLVFAPCAYNLAETTRMIEIAKGIRSHELAGQVFNIQFISDGGNLEQLIEDEGFLLKRMEPRLTEEKIQHIAAVDRGEEFSAAFSLRDSLFGSPNPITRPKLFKGPLPNF